MENLTILYLSQVMRPPTYTWIVFLAKLIKMILPANINAILYVKSFFSAHSILATVSQRITKETDLRTLAEDGLLVEKETIDARIEQNSTVPFAAFSIPSRVASKAKQFQSSARDTREI